MTDPRSTQRFLRAHTRAIVRVSDAAITARFIIDGASGRLLVPIQSPVTPADLDSITLFIPDESESAAQVYASGALVDDPSVDPLCDRWLAYHGSRPLGRVSILTPLGYRLGAFVADADEIDLRNPLVSAEPRLVRTVNADLPALASLAARVAGAAVLEPRCVGVDDLGLDVRTRLGVLRVEHAEPVLDADAALASIAALLAGSAG